MCQKEGGLDAGLVEIRRSVIMGEGAFEMEIILKERNWELMFQVKGMV